MLPHAIFKSVILGFIIVFCSWAHAQDADDKSKYIGFQYNNPMVGEKVSDLTVKGGGLISGIMPGDSGPTYGIGQMGKAGTEMLWLQKAIAQDSKGITRWQVKDVLVFPSAGKTQEIHSMGDPTCQKDGKEPPNLVVLTDAPPQGRPYQVQRAWLANSKTEKFVEIPIQGISCHSYMD